jgi:hypothetical protein
MKGAVVTVSTIEETIQDRDTGEEVPVTYWEFKMRAGQDAPTEPGDDYYMVTMYDDRNRLWASFHSWPGSARSALQYEDYSDGELSVPWTLFARAAGRILAGAAAAPLEGGELRRAVNGTEIEYETGCGQLYAFSQETLEGLLA